MEQRLGRFVGVIRPLRAGDLPTVEQILRTWVRDPSSGLAVTTEIAEFLEQMSSSLVEGRGYRYLVAVTNDETVIGVVGMRPLSPEMLPFATTEHPVELINSYVDAAHRNGHGVGTSLVRELERLARHNGYSEIIVNSGPRYQHSGWGFYDKLGYERRDMALDLYGDGVHAPVWSAIL